MLLRLPRRRAAALITLSIYLSIYLFPLIKNPDAITKGVFPRADGRMGGRQTDERTGGRTAGRLDTILNSLAVPFPIFPTSSPSFHFPSLNCRLTMIFFDKFIV